MGLVLGCCGNGSQLIDREMMEDSVPMILSEAKADIEELMRNATDPTP